MLTNSIFYERNAILLMSDNKSYDTQIHYRYTLKHVYIHTHIKYIYIYI